MVIYDFNLIKSEAHKSHSSFNKTADNVTWFTQEPCAVWKSVCVWVISRSAWVYGREESEYAEIHVLYTLLALFSFLKYKPSLQDEDTNENSPRWLYYIKMKELLNVVWKIESFGHLILQTYDILKVEVCV